MTNNQVKIEVENCTTGGDLSQQWLRTRHAQFRHVRTSKCIQQNEAVPANEKATTWHLGLEECNTSETKQKWNCSGQYLRREIVMKSGQKDFLYITLDKAWKTDDKKQVWAKLQTAGHLTHWKSFKSNFFCLSSRMYIFNFIIFTDYRFIL